MKNFDELRSAERRLRNQLGCVYAYKGVFGAVALANPRAGVAYVVGSVNPSYKVGQAIPLE